MEAERIFIKCKELAIDMEAFFSYYKRYRACISSTYFDNELSEVLRKTAGAYNQLMAAINKGITTGQIASPKLKIAGEATARTEYEFLTPEEIIALMDKNRLNIIAMLNIATHQQRSCYLYNFESCHTDTRQLINRLQMMIRNSQNIFQPYLKATA